MAVTTKQGFLRQAWDLAWPYWKSEEKWSAIGLLAAVIALNLITVWLNVRFNYWNNDFYNALQEYDWAECDIGGGGAEPMGHADGVRPGSASQLARRAIVAVVL